MKVTLWYRYDKKTDAYSYNHLQKDGHFLSRVPKGSTPENEKKFKSSRWLNEFAWLVEGVVVYEL